MASRKPITWRETFARLREDRARIRSVMHGGKRRGLLFHPSFVCVALYRVSHKLHESGWNTLSRMFWILNVVLTGSDLSPGSDLGGGLVIVSPPGVALAGKAGRNLTVMPLVGLGGELGRREDVGAGPGLPVLGDDVVLEPHTGVLGPVRVGNRVHAAAGTIVTVDVPDDSRVEGPRVRFLSRADAR